jgi:peptidoglycan-associated lipoprotein
LTIERLKKELEMKRRTSLIAMAAMLSLTAGCAHRRTAAELPPQPPSSSETAENSGDQSGNITGTPLPGSRRDFLQSVPSDRVFFDTDSYSLDSQSRATLDAQAAWLARNASVRVTIEGHADERGTREYNLALGDRRANSARDYLQSRGVSAARMQTISWGKERPAVDGHDESAWAQNRRAVTVVPE